MSSRRRVSYRGRLFWFLLIACVWFFTRHAFVGTNTELFDKLGHRFAQWGEAEHAQLVLPGGKVQMESYEVEQRSLHCPPVGTLELDDATCREFFAALPLGPQDLAVLLNRMQKSGITTVGISSPLTWQVEAGDMTRQLLCRVLLGFPNPVLGLRGRTAAQADFTPVILRDYAVPDSQISGDPTGLPVANRPLPNGLTDTPDSLGVPWAPDWLADEPLTQHAPVVDSFSFPLLVRWNGQTMPTLPLRLALAHAGLTAADVHVRIGQDIRFGSRTLPLDAHGRTRLTEGLAIPLNIATLGSEDGGLQKQFGQRGCAIIEQPAGTAGDTRRLNLLARTLSQLVGVEKVHRSTMQRPIGGKVLHLHEGQEGWGFLSKAAAALALILLIFPALPFVLRFLGSLGLLFLLLRWALSALEAGTWVNLTSALCCWALLFLALLFLRPRDKGYFGTKHHERNMRG